eukprot:6180798-Pleurochrysis_carterae.AAC.1
MQMKLQSLAVVTSSPITDCIATATLMAALLAAAIGGAASATTIIISKAHELANIVIVAHTSATAVISAAIAAAVAFTTTIRVALRVTETAAVVAVTVTAKEHGKAVTQTARFASLVLGPFRLRQRLLRAALKHKSSLAVQLPRPHNASNWRHAPAGLAREGVAEDIRFVSPKCLAL